MEDVLISLLRECWGPAHDDREFARIVRGGATIGFEQMSVPAPSSGARTNTMHLPSRDQSWGNSLARPAGISEGNG